MPPVGVKVVSTPPKRRVLIPSGALIPPASLNGVLRGSEDVEVGGRRGRARVAQPEVRHVDGRDAVLRGRDPGQHQVRVELPIGACGDDRKLLEEHAAVGVRGTEGHLAHQPALRGTVPETVIVLMSSGDVLGLPS